MRKKRFSRWTIWVILLFLILIVAGFFFFRAINADRKDDGDIIVKDNVYVITDETEREEQPYYIEEDRLVFKTNPKYKKDDVIVAGIINNAREGFLRKVINVKEQNGEYVVETEPAVLTDVFEKAHVAKTFRLTEDGVEEVTQETTQVNMTDEIQMASYDGKALESAYSVMKLSDKEKQDDDLGDYLFDVSFKEEIENVTVSGEAGFNIWLEFKFDIQRGNIVFGIAIRDESGGELQLICGTDFDKEIEKSIYEKKLPNFEFSVGGIPIVVTNEIEAVVGGDIEIEGGIGIFYEVTCENAHGFLYDSKKGKVEEIKERNYDSDGLEWNTVQVSGDSTAEIAMHLISKLYGSTGMDLSIGVSGEVDGVAKISVNPELAGYAGSLELSVSPQIEGSVVVSVPVIDKKLAEQPLFRTNLKPFWEKKWKSSANWKADLEWTEAGEQGGKDNIYVTRFGEVNAVTCPVFQFEIPSGWEITTEEVNGLDIIQENVVLSNDRGVTISYWSCGRKLGGASRMMAKANVTKIADSEFVPGYPAGVGGDTDYSSLGEFMVAKVKVIGELSMDGESDYTSVDGETFYAVVPESYLGEREFAKQVGNVDAFSFEYPTPYAFIAESPDGTFTEREEREVGEILQSFQVAK